MMVLAMMVMITMTSNDGDDFDQYIIMMAVVLVFYNLSKIRASSPKDSLGPSSPT